MDLLLIGLATAFNLIIIKVKVEKRRWGDAALDTGTLFLLGIAFGGSYAGLVVATISSAIISLYLLAFPPKIPSFS